MLEQSHSLYTTFVLGGMPSQYKSDEETVVLPVDVFHTAVQGLTLCSGQFVLHAKLTLYKTIVCRGIAAAGKP